jgi:hypothetical protein
MTGIGRCSPSRLILVIRVSRSVRSLVLGQNITCLWLVQLDPNGDKFLVNDGNYVTARRCTEIFGVHCILLPTHVAPHPKIQPQNQKCQPSIHSQAVDSQRQRLKPPLKCTHLHR